jgi:hypothetical protein
VPIAAVEVNPFDRPVAGVEGGLTREFTAVTLAHVRPVDVTVLLVDDDAVGHFG